MEQNLGAGLLNLWAIGVLWRFRMAKIKRQTTDFGLDDPMGAN